MNTMPKTWDEFQWDDWVPQQVRHQIQGFRPPHEWEEGRIHNDAPALGRRVRVPSMDGKELLEGRYVHYINNIGRLVLDDGTVKVVGCSQWQPVDGLEERIEEIKQRQLAEGKTVYREQEWFAEGERLFGPDRNTWTFQCVSCGNAQSANSVIAHGYQKPPEEIRIWVASECEGRHNSSYSNGCDWSLGGLFQIHKVVLITEKGVVFPMFDFYREQAS